MGKPFGVQQVTDLAIHPGEDSTLDRQWGGSRAAYTNHTAAGSSKSGGGVFYGFECTNGTSVTVTVYDNTAASGTVLFQRTVSAGNGYAPPAPMTFVTGCYVSFSGTCTLNVLRV